MSANYNRLDRAKRLKCNAGVFVILLFLLAGSGCAALIYEIVWFQLLQLVIGSSAVSLGLLLAFYMGGLCLGSAAYPRFARQRNPLRVYAFLEVGIGAFGIIVLFAMPLIGRPVNLVTVVRRQSLEGRARDQRNAVGMRQAQARFDDALIPQADDEARALLTAFNFPFRQ